MSRPPRMKTSPVWKYFQKIDLDDQQYAVCMFCNRQIRMSGWSTSSLLKHLVRFHPIEAPIEGKTSTPGAMHSNYNSRKNKKSSASGTKAKTKTLSTIESGGDNLFSVELMDSSTLKRRDLSTKYFKLNKDTGSYKCALCISNLKYYSDGHIDHLKKHMKRKHPELYASLESPELLKSEPMSHSSFTEVASPVKKVDQFISTRNQNLDNKIASMVVLDLQPYSIVESKGFLDLMMYADPRYTVPSKKKLMTQLLPNLYKETAAEVLKKLADVSNIALTTDMCSPRKDEIYLSVTAYFISQVTWNLQSVMLSTIAFYGNPSGKDISTELQNVVTEWRLMDKVTVMITDNETNVLLSNEQLPWAYVPCLGYLLHLVITDAIAADNDVIALIEKVRDVVNFFQHSHEAMQSLLVTQNSMELLPSENEPVKLILDVPSRWNSIYYMLERVYQLTDSVNAVLELNGMNEKRLSDQEVAILKRILSSLKPFVVATKTLSDDQNCSISMALPLIKGLAKMMENVTDAKEPLTQNLKDGLLVSFGKIEEIEWIVTATLLDPRFKRFPFANKEAIEKSKGIILMEVSNLSRDSNESSLQTHDATASSSKHGSFWEFLDNMTDTSDGAPEPVISSVANREVQVYLNSPSISRDEDPLFYWKQHQELLPNLYKVALKYMAVPITSVPSDRLFSKTGEMITEKRSKLKAKNINMVLFLNQNLDVDKD